MPDKLVEALASQAVPLVLLLVVQVPQSSLVVRPDFFFFCKRSLNFHSPVGDRKARVVWVVVLP